MNKRIIFLLLVLYSGILFGQSLIETNKTWHVIEFVNYGASNTISYKFQGDTLINDQSYKKLFRTSDSTYSNWYYKDAFREDSLKRIYRHISQSEELFYDFGLNVNDEFNGVIYECDVELTVDSIDMVSLENGESRKRLILNYGSPYQEEWIEGIGSLFGLIHVGCEHCASDIWYELNCFIENDTLKYNNPNYDPCYYTTVSINFSDDRTNWNVSPNPAQDLLFIKNSNLHFNYSIELRNLYGQLVLQERGIQSSQYALKIAGLKPGVYFYMIKENGEVVQQGKIIKK